MTLLIDNAAVRRDADTSAQQDLSLDTGIGVDAGSSIPSAELDAPLAADAEREAAFDVALGEDASQDKSKPRQDEGVEQDPQEQIRQLQTTMGELTKSEAAIAQQLANLQAQLSDLSETKQRLQQQIETIQAEEAKKRETASDTEAVATEDTTVVEPAVDSTTTEAEIQADVTADPKATPNTQLTDYVVNLDNRDTAIAYDLHEHQDEFRQLINEDPVKALDTLATYGAARGRDPEVAARFAKLQQIFEVQAETELVERGSTPDQAAEQVSAALKSAHAEIIKQDLFFTVSGREATKQFNNLTKAMGLSPEESKAMATTAMATHIAGLEGRELDLQYRRLQGMEKTIQSLGLGEVEELESARSRIREGISTEAQAVLASGDIEQITKQKERLTKMGFTPAEQRSIVAAALAEHYAKHQALENPTLQDANKAFDFQHDVAHAFDLEGAAWREYQGRYTALSNQKRDLRNNALQERRQTGYDTLKEYFSTTAPDTSNIDLRKEVEKVYEGKDMVWPKPLAAAAEGLNDRLEATLAGEHSLQDLQELRRLFNKSNTALSWAFNSDLDDQKVFNQAREKLNQEIVKLELQEREQALGKVQGMLRGEVMLRGSAGTTESLDADQKLATIKQYALQNGVTDQQLRDEFQTFASSELTAMAVSAGRGERPIDANLTERVDFVRKVAADANLYADPGFQERIEAFLTRVQDDKLRYTYSLLLQSSSLLQR